MKHDSKHNIGKNRDTYLHIILPTYVNHILLYMWNMYIVSMNLVQSSVSSVRRYVIREMNIAWNGLCALSTSSTTFCKEAGRTNYSHQLKGMYLIIEYQADFNYERSQFTTAPTYVQHNNNEKQKSRIPQKNFLIQKMNRINFNGIP